jgi:polyphosphate kinase
MTVTGPALAAMLAVCTALPALAHPHVFIDTKVEVILNPEGKVDAIRVTWIYDELYSLSIIEDRGFDPDFDGVLDSAEKAALSGFDMVWDEGYSGDTYVLAGEMPLGLSGPSDWTADYVAGQLVSTHLRRVETPVDPLNVPFAVQSYDPSYYVSYRIVGTPKVTGGTDCTVAIFQPDFAAADKALEAALEEYYGSDLEGDFPAIGAAYSDEVRLTCPARS